MAVINQVGNLLTGVTGTGKFVGDTAPLLVTPKIGQINDTNGVAIVSLTPVASAVNYFTWANNVAGSAPQFSVVGADADVSMILNAKGLGKFSLVSAALTQPFQISNGTASQHATIFEFANTFVIRTVTFPDATGTLLMTGQAISTVPSIAFSSTTGVVGTTTNDSAAAGSVGELISSTIASGSAGAQTSTVSRDVTSISLTAGDWDVWGTVGTVPAAGTTTSRVNVSISTTSVTQPAPAASGGTLATYNTAGGATIANIVPSGTTRISISGTTTVYLVANVTFAISTLSTYGYIAARRMR